MDDHNENQPSEKKNNNNGGLQNTEKLLSSYVCYAYKLTCLSCIQAHRLCKVQGSVYSALICQCVEIDLDVSNVRKNLAMESTKFLTLFSLASIAFLVTTPEVLCDKR